MSPGRVVSLWVIFFLAGVEHAFSMRKMRAASISLLCLVLISGCNQSTEPVSLTEAWKKNTTFMANEAYRDFIRLSDTDDPETLREVRLGQAISLLARQPRIAANLQESERMLLQLIEENGGDEVGLTARLALGRYYQLHSPAPSFERARQVFIRLFDEHPHTMQGQHAFAHYTMLTLLPQVTNDLEFAGVVAELERRAERLTFPSAELMFNLAVGAACAYRKLEPEVLIRRFSAAAESEFIDSRRKSNCLVIAGNAALRSGNIREANRLFSQFVKDFPMDTRNYTVQLILNKINLDAEANQAELLHPQ